VSAEVETGPGTGSDGTPTDLRLHIDASTLDDVEVAAVTVAVTALLGGGGAAPPTPAEPAWRRAGLLEASAGRRVRTPAELTHAERW